MKKIAFLLVALMLTISAGAQTNTQKHEVQSGETLTSIARSYGVSLGELKKLNPKLDADHIMAGQKINVPNTGKKPVQQNAQQQQDKPAFKLEKVGERESVPATNILPVRHVVETENKVPERPKYKATHEVKKKETIYSISREYGLTEQELISANPSIATGKLKKGTILNIPYSAEEDRVYQQELARKREEEEKKKIKIYNSIKVAVILPFNASASTVSVESQKMVNLYQGFLLAVDSLKSRGVNVDISAYDESSATIDNILQKPEMKQMTMIVGPARQGNVSSVASYAHKNGIINVVPLSSDLSIVNERPTTFQVNVATSSIYKQVYNRFIALHRNENIVFVGMNDKADNNNYIVDFKKSLDDANLLYNRISISEISTLTSMLKEGTKNVIIPSSGSSAAFDNLCKALKKYVPEDKYDIQLFGFPEWQTLAGRQDENLAKYRCQFFATFYTNPYSTRTSSFNSLFRRWFHQEQYQSYPRYGELGYDIGCYFLKGIADYGDKFTDNIHSYVYNSLEFPFNFEKKNSWSGYQNNAIEIVTYNSLGRTTVR